MKKIAIALFAVALGAGAAWAKMGQAKMDHMKPMTHRKAAMSGHQTIKGELVDMDCYMAMRAHGPKHRMCARMCVLKDGAPLGVLTKSGRLYLLVGDHANMKAYAAAKQLTGYDASLSGRVVRAGGLPAIIVDQVDKI